MNSNKLLKTSSTQNHGTLRIFSTAVGDPREKRRGPAPSSVFLKDRESTHTFNNKGQNCMECKLNDLPRGHVWTILPSLSPDTYQSSIIFGSENINEVDKYR